MKINQQTQEKFMLRHGQFFAYYRYKNLLWDLNGEFFGFGDLRDEDIIHIQEELVEGEVFTGWNEHHGTEWQQTDVPMIVITHDDIKFRQELVGIPCQDLKCNLKWGHNHNKEERKS